MNWIKYRPLYFLISLIFILIGVFSLLKWGLVLGVDFTGGAVVEYRFSDDISTEVLNDKLDENDFEVSSIQQTSTDSYFLKFPPLDEEKKNQLSQVITEEVDSSATELRYEQVGPSIGPELVQKTIYAITISAFGILLWIAFQFKSLKFGISGVLAMLHDSFILVGIFSLLGHFMGAEVDFLFVTALLTTLSFSVHDTIVVYDRIRESGGADDVKNVANQALSETMVRSLNNSFTIIFMLVALVLLGGTTIKWFAVALFIGTVLGTYSSPFVAVPLLVTFDEAIDKFKKRDFSLNLTFLPFSKK